MLNSLTSPAMVAASLACLRPCGRMAEISKRDVWSPQRVAQERPDVAYTLVAIDFLPPAVRALHPLPPGQHHVRAALTAQTASCYSGLIWQVNKHHAASLLCPGKTSVSSCKICEQEQCR